jgi:16S rRNA (cytosine1402-N4)-methyltransferase
MEGLALRPGGTYLDCTLGGAGHFRGIIEALDQDGTAVGLDRDPEAIAWAEAQLPPSRCRIILEHAHFARFDEVLDRHGIAALDGVLLDLGLSSHQIDAPERGFSYMADAPLDMRMDRSQPTTAADLLRETDESTLARILGDYGEIRNAPRMAHAITSCRREHAIERTEQLKGCLRREYGPNLKIKMLAKLFQALRIAVNDELVELRTFLDRVLDYLRTGGRLVVLSYHSLEDRLVKNFMRRNEQPCVCPISTPVCTCGGVVRLKRITRKALRPSPAETQSNSRARSARLRVAEKTA